MIHKELPKAYIPTEHEDRMYEAWEASGACNPDTLDVAKNAPSFTIMMPPPNATGVLHLGHASMLAYEDLMIRYQRLQGKRALYVPGTDHASIATQNVVEKMIFEKEGKTRHEVGREDLLSQIDAFVEAKQDTIKNQIRKMGASCDWSRERFTLDERMAHAVRETFVKMYKDGLIYRGDRVVNWCPRCKSTLADDEVDHKDTSAQFYTFKYSQDFPFAISTTRPETKLADTAVAVHPSDERYKEYIGQTFEIPFAGGTHLTIKVIGDHHVDKDFGTGALGVTPAHSMVDYQMAVQQNLPIIKLIDEDGMINENGGEFAGLTTLEARKKVVEYLRDNNLMIEEKDIAQSLSLCYRCGSTIEPIPSLQWFVNVSKKVRFPGALKKESLKERSLKVVRKGQISFVPERFEKTYTDWIENLNDWCISRQIWYGHQIPVWYRGDDMYVGVSAPQGEGWVQETDTLDTWFSSGQWTFAALGFYEGHTDYKNFHPTQVLETGYDIISFWVARMILMTTYVTGDIPFETVYLHGLIRDEQGQKMSKSKGNGIDPLDMIEKYGADALRMSLIVGATPGNDMRLGEAKIEGYRNFVNKLYNVARFIFTSVDEVQRVSKRPQTVTRADEWILNELDKITLEVSDKIEKYQFSAAGENLRMFTWDVLADWYIEIAKVEENTKDEILLYILERLLVLWHPFVPYVTEYLWSFFGEDQLLMTHTWPQVKTSDIKEIAFDEVIEAVRTIRTMRGENKIDPAVYLNARLVVRDVMKFESEKPVIQKLARLENLDIVADLVERPVASAASVFGEGNTVYLLLEGLIDIEKETARLEKEIEQTHKLLRGAEGKLANKNFVESAPADVVAGVKESYELNKEKLAKLQGQLDSMRHG
jgi:valyl-tRNA synthetase